MENEKEEKKIVIEIPNFAREITLSNKRRASYYKKGEKIPKKYQDADEEGGIIYPKNRYYWQKGRLYQKSDYTPVLKNPNSVGTPKTTTIAGNDLWNTHRIGNYTELIKITLQEWLWEVICHYNLQSVDITDLLPMRVHLDFHTYKEPQDLDNLDLFYRKAFADAIQDNKHKNETRWLRNDNTRNIKSFVTDHNDVKNKSEEKLIITITKAPVVFIDYNKETLEFNTSNLKPISK